MSSIITLRLQTGRHLAVAAGMAILLLITSGCLIVPTRLEHHTDHGTHKPLDGALYNQLREGEATKTSVHQLVGRRDVSLAHDTVWVYSWEERCEWQMFAFAVGTGGGGGGFFGNEDVSVHYAILEFDSSGVLTRKCRRDHGRINGLATNLNDAMMK